MKQTEIRIQLVNKLLPCRFSLVQEFYDKLPFHCKLQNSQIRQHTYVQLLIPQIDQLKLIFILSVFIHKLLKNQIQAQFLASISEVKNCDPCEISLSTLTLFMVLA